MRVGEIMRSNVVTIEPKATASAALARMKRQRIRHLVVTQEARVVGVISERDLDGRGGPGVRAGRTVKELMSKEVVSTEPDTTLEEAADLMRERLVGSLPVLEGDRLVGIVTATDVLDELGRESEEPRTPGGRRRAPFPGQLPKALKRVVGRAKAPLVPANIRVTGVNLSDENRAEIREKLGKSLGKFATSIERITVRVTDVNGPRGGIDRLCQIKVVLSDLPSVVVEKQHRSLAAALGAALDGAERAVRKSVQRSRTKPARAVRGRSSG